MAMGEVDGMAENEVLVRGALILELNLSTEQRCRIYPGGANKPFCVDTSGPQLVYTRALAHGASPIGLAC